MSLCARYLFNGNVTNSGSTATNDTWSKTPSYKPGNIYEKSISEGAMTWDAETTAKILNNEAFTWMCWIYVDPNDGKENGLLFGNNGFGSKNNRKFSIFQHPSQNDIYWSWMNDLGAVTFTTGTLKGVLPSYEWTHVAFVFGDKALKIYINGSLEYSHTGIESTSETFAYTTNVVHSFKGRRLQDLRIYNEAVNEEEIREIAYGLAQHNKFIGTDSNTPRYNKSTYISKSTVKSGFCPNRTNDICISFWAQFPEQLKTFEFFKCGNSKDSAKGTKVVYKKDSSTGQLHYDSSTTVTSTTYKTGEEVTVSGDTTTSTEWKGYIKSGITYKLDTRKVTVTVDDVTLDVCRIDNDYWHNFVLNIDGERNITAYVDGVKKAEGKTVSPSSVDRSDSTELPTFTAPIRVSDLRIYGRHLSEEDALGLYGIKPEDYKVTN